MSSTSEDAERAAREFFQGVLSPLGRQLRVSRVVLADVAQRRAAESFYEPAPVFGKGDFEVIVGGDPDTLQSSLLKQWKDEPALHALARKLAELSGKIGTEVEHSGEVSPFVYVMF